ncbi:MAG: class I SAM-dependent methyltransferase [Bryobacteraceae bacterium]|nr:class I SAM-dependent methyltransferase [Bryobacteraceae bacterium]
MSATRAVDDSARPFPFGRNWEEFVRKHFSEERVRVSREHILKFLDLPDLKGKSFLDVGCGSGLSSLAAWEAGADRVVSFDVDADSVKTTEQLRRLRGSPGNWTVLAGSALDEAFLRSTDPADIVYSWGVLHHTGRMWQAIRNAAIPLKSGALFYIALYLTSARSGYWLAVKKKYNSASTFQKRVMEARYVVRHVVVPKLVRGQNPIRFIRTYEQRRGMAFLPDVRDWLGGYPYEDATIPEVLRFCNRELGLNLVNINPGSGLAEYLFHKP